MTAAYCGAGLIDRRGRPADALAAAALATLALNPSYLFDTGCQLSFLAVAAIVWGAAPVAARLTAPPSDPLDALEHRFRRRWPRAVREKVAQSLAISAVVWLAAVPLTALRFHLVSPVGVLLNVPLVPITSAALLAAGVSLGMSAVWGPLGTPAGWVCSGLLWLTERLVRWGAALPWGHAFVPEPDRGWVLGFYLALGLAGAALVGRWPGRRIAAGLFAGWTALGLAPAAWEITRAGGGAAGPPTAEVLAVGHGLAVVVQTAPGRALLYDCGRMRDPSVGRRIIAPALRARGVRRLDAVVLSHADADHYNGLRDLLDRIPVGRVLVPEHFAGPDNPGASELLDLVRARGVPVETVAAGSKWSAGGTDFVVRHPPAGWEPSTSDNARSVVLDVAWRGRHALLTGDLEGEGLIALLDRPRVGPVDALLAPHHGARAANPGQLYDWARPALIVVSQRPPPSLARDPLAGPVAGPSGRPVPVYRTWRDGAVRLRWTETGITAAGFLDAAKGGRASENVANSPLTQ
jgi:competence protein ComEC